MRRIMKFDSTIMISMIFIIFIFSSCDLDEIQDPDGPSVGGVESEASIGQLNEIIAGIVSTSRNGLGVEVTVSGSMARELYLFDADPGNTGDVLGKNNGRLSNSAFYSVSQWNGSYRCIKNANILIEAANNTSSVTQEQQNGYLGVAKTFQAYELIQILKSYGQARLDVADENNIGPILDFNQALDGVRELLNEALANLNNAGDEFAFPIAGFSGFDEPSTFIQFNRAVAAVAAVYDENGTDALSALEASFFDLGGDITRGPRHIFSQNADDRPNPVFRAASESAERPNNSDQIIVHDSWINDAEAGDTRVAQKAAVRPDPSIQDELTGTHETRLYATNESPVSIIRNEELILIYAEANILTNDLTEAVNALNVIRSSAGLADYSGAVTSEALTTEMLNQRRYSLWCENHRMFDLRRYGLSNTLPIDRDGDQIFNLLPVPLSENVNQ